MPANLSRIHAFESLLAQQGESYLVGSANWGIGASLPDHDYVSRADPLVVGALLASTWGGRMVVLDQNRRYVRLVLAGLRPIDLTPLQGGSISSDLAQRDFTVNAMAAMLPARSPFLDPFAGRVDLRYGVLRQVSLAAFWADPLRILRGVRLMAERGFTIEPATRRSMQEATPLLSIVHPERIRVELQRALQADRWLQAAQLMLELEAWSSLPVWPPLHPEPSKHCQQLRHVESLVLSNPLSPLCEQDSLGAAERPLAVLASVLITSNLSAEETESVGRQLRLSRNEISLLSSICRAFASICSSPERPDAFDLMDRHGCAAIWASAMAGDQHLLADLLALQLPTEDVLPNGAELAAALARNPGPWLGVLLRELRRAAALGTLANKADALRLAQVLTEQQAEVDDSVGGDREP
ncbi:MAG: hypothetical protein ACUVWR_00960 [Anaerolineae bacterium]